MRSRQINVNLRERPSCGGLLELALTRNWPPLVSIALNTPSTEQLHVGPPTSPIGHLHHPILRFFLLPCGRPSAPHADAEAAAPSASAEPAAAFNALGLRFPGNFSTGCHPAAVMPSIEHTTVVRSLHCGPRRLLSPCVQNIHDSPQVNLIPPSLSDRIWR